MKVHNKAWADIAKGVSKEILRDKIVCVAFSEAAEVAIAMDGHQLALLTTRDIDIVTATKAFEGDKNARLYAAKEWASLFRGIPAREWRDGVEITQADGGLTVLGRTISPQHSGSAYPKVSMACELPAGTRRVCFTRQVLATVLAGMPSSKREQPIRWSVGTGLEPTHMSSSAQEGLHATHWHGVVMPYRDTDAPKHVDVDEVSQIKAAHEKELEDLRAECKQLLDDQRLIHNQTRSDYTDAADKILALQAKLTRAQDDLERMKSSGRKVVKDLRTTSEVEEAQAEEIVKLETELSETQEALEVSEKYAADEEKRADAAEAEDRAELLDVIRPLHACLNMPAGTPEAVIAVTLKEAGIALELARGLLI